MARRTRKYVAAERLASQLNITNWRQMIASGLYQELGEHGYHWNSDSGTWENWTAMPADGPSEVIRLRCWARTEVVEMIADGVIESMAAAGLRLIERSQPYVCRPPKQNDSRIYLTFSPA